MFHNNTGFVMTIILIISLAQKTTCECGNYCKCYMWNGLKRADCIHKGLLNIQTRVDDDVQVYDLSENGIWELQDNEFKDSDLRELKYLILARNLILHVGKRAFRGLNVLKYVDLSGNRITSLYPETFHDNPSLFNLILRDNPFSTIAEGQAILSSTSLHELDLGKCRQTILPHSTFNLLPSLATLNLSENYLIHFDIETVTPLLHLKMLDISKNSFTCNDKMNELEEYLQVHYISHTPVCGTVLNITLPSTILDPNADVEFVNEGDVGLEQVKVKPADIILGKKIIDDETDDDDASSDYSLPMIWSLIVGFQVGMFVAIVSIFSWLWIRDNNLRCNPCRLHSAEGGRHRLLRNTSATELDTIHL